MIHLLDVNALVALGFINHEFHARVASWVQSSHSPQLGELLDHRARISACASPSPGPMDSPSLKRAHCCCVLRRAAPLASHSLQTNTMFLIFRVGSERLSKLPMVI